jgi:hypothetical protein
LAIGSAPGAAQVRHPRGYYGDSVQPLDRILPQIRSGHPGRFYDAEGPFADPYGGWHYRVKWLTPEGRVIWLDADARSGRVVGLPSTVRPYMFGPPPPRAYMMPPRYYAPRPGFGRGGFRGGWGGHRGR